MTTTEITRARLAFTDHNLTKTKSNLALKKRSEAEILKACKNITSLADLRRLYGKASALQAHNNRVDNNIDDIRKVNQIMAEVLESGDIVTPWSIAQYLEQERIVYGIGYSHTTARYSIISLVLKEWVKEGKANIVNVRKANNHYGYKTAYEII